MKSEALEIFEVHITGDESIHKATDLKTISVDLLRPDKSVLRTEHMTSAIMKYENFKSCLNEVKLVVKSLRNKGVSIQRVKIECPYYKHYHDQSLYMESHFVTNDLDYPISKNQRKTTILGTDRTYKQEEYSSFRQKWAGRELELCLFDSYIEEDADWLNLWTKTN